MSSGMEV
jgi:hypothetical protein